jgi:hypothetical protein
MRPGELVSGFSRILNGFGGLRPGCAIKARLVGIESARRKINFEAVTAFVRSVDLSKHS